MSASFGNPLAALLALSLSALQTPVGASATASGSSRPVVVELFTSQGCSSCPPADRLLAALGAAGEGSIIPLAFHVDSWNHIGWTDPFSSAEWTRRQAQYVRKLKAKGPYTPQAVVDGAVALLGSDEKAIRASIDAAAARPAGVIALALDEHDAALAVRADVLLPDALRGRGLDLMVAIFETGLVTPVKRGENGGRTLRNEYVVRRFRRFARLEADGSERTQHRVELKLAESWQRSEVGVAVFLQDPRSLEIRGAQSQWLIARR